MSLENLVQVAGIIALKDLVHQIKGFIIDIQSLQRMIRRNTGSIHLLLINSDFLYKFFRSMFDTSPLAPFDWKFL